MPAVSHQRAFRLEIRYNIAFRGNYGVYFGGQCSILYVDVFVWTKTTRPRTTGLAGRWPSWWKNEHSNPARKHLSKRAGCQPCNSRDAADFPLAWNDWAVTYFVSNYAWQIDERKIKYASHKVTVYCTAGDVCWFLKRGNSKQGPFETRWLGVNVLLTADWKPLYMKLLSWQALCFLQPFQTTVHFLRGKYIAADSSTKDVITDSTNSFVDSPKTWEHPFRNGLHS